MPDPASPSSPATETVSRETAQKAIRAVQKEAARLARTLNEVIEQRDTAFDRGLTVEQAAEAIGVHRDLLRRAELGENVPRPPSAKMIANFYGFKPSEIWPIDAGGDPDPVSNKKPTKGGNE